MCAGGEDGGGGFIEGDVRLVLGGVGRIWEEMWRCGLCVSVALFKLLGV